jgi:uncharacterized protein YgiM (DUF1202 family)
VVSVVGATALAIALSACGSSGHHAVPTTAPTTATTVRAPITTVPGMQASGSRTVLSPIGLHLRAQPARSAHILGTAAQGAVVDVLGHVAAGGGWYQVKGAIHTGWISDSRTLSAPGLFRSYASGQFSVLYPSTWTSTVSAPNSVTFRAGIGAESIVVRTATTVAQVGTGRAGYGEVRSETVVACGITVELHTYAATGHAQPEPYLAQVRLTLDAKHALGVDANLPDTQELQTVRDFIDSITFPAAPCQA